MKNIKLIISKSHLGMVCIMLLGICLRAEAAVTTDLATEPLASSASASVRPNILFTLDDSGSMAWAYLPDYAGGTTYGGGTANHCKVSNTCNAGEVPFQTNEYNGMAYNPRITYKRPLRGDGTSFPNQGSPWTTVAIDGFGVQSAGTINLTTGYPEVVYSTSGSAPFKQSGIDTNNPFSYRPTKNGTTAGAIPVPDTNDDAPLYSYPGSQPSGGAIVSTVYSGLLNQSPYATNTIFSGNLDVSTAADTYNLSGVGISHSSTTVTVSYTPNATKAPLANGDTVIVSGGSCSSGYKSGGSSRPITIVNASQFTYISNAGTAWNNTSCTVQVTHAAHTAVVPKISKAGTTVTVTLAAAPVPALVNGALLTASNGAGTCDAGYQASSVIMSVTNSTTFTYTASAAVVNASTANCSFSMTTGAPPASPGIRLIGNTVTVYLTAHGLVTGDAISVADVTAGSCAAGYQTAISPVTRIDANTFTYLTAGGASASSNCVISKLGAVTTTAYTTASTRNGAPYYFALLATEYCDSIYLTNCVAASAPTGAYTNPAPVRFCRDAATSILPPGDAGAQSAAGATINCQAKYSVGTGLNFQFARYGIFWRGDIIPARTTYGNEVIPAGTKIDTYGYLNANAANRVLDYSNMTAIDRSKRADCVAVPNCTYTEEMTNFANWYAYYRTRMQMMKSAAGLAFAPLDNRYRVGFVTINQNSAAEYLAVAQFDQTQKTNWYNAFYAILPGNSTPLRSALSNAGRYFAGKQPGIMTGDPMEYSCQQNFEILTTDGYWNGTTTPKQIDGATDIGNVDNTDANPSLRSEGIFDGGVTGATSTLADTALYYYKTDLRNSTFSNCNGALGSDVCADNVPMTSKDTAAGLKSTQHMKVFSLGLADGLMSYQKDYETALSGDVYKIKIGSAGCPFSGAGTCNWPLPVADSQTALDDLWHAAVNGRGTYYQARNPAELTQGLEGALSGIGIRTAAAAASATSSPIITQGDNVLFSSTYRTVKWDGDVRARYIDPGTGNIITTGGPNNDGVVWSAQTQLDNKVAAETLPGIPGRLIYMLDPATVLTGSGLRDFNYSIMSVAEKTYFDNKCIFTLLSQCSVATLTAGEILLANDGNNLVNYLRGNRSLEKAPVTNDEVFQARDHILGDTVNAKPAYVKSSLYSFTDTGYATFKAAASSRQGALYMGANDGMLHVFNTTTGDEMWSYVPSMLLPDLYKLADANYPTKHQSYVDGSPETMDIYVDATTSSASGLTVGWHTILVGGLGRGGRGYYALDVTDPLNPKGMWEICSDSALCAINDPDIGFSYGNPVIVKRSTDGKWILMFTSGYNNVSPGSGQGILFVLDVATGQILSKTSTGVATTPPSGLSKISPWIDNAYNDLTTRYVYGGDLNGNVWRFDLGAVGSIAPPTVTQIATLKDSLGNPQSITTRPTMGDPLTTVSNSLLGTGKPAVYVGTGRYLGVSDVMNSQVQSIYAMKDDLSLSGALAYIGNPRTLALAGASSNSIAYPVTQLNLHQVDAVTLSSSGGTVNWGYDKAGWFMDFEITDSSNVPITPSVHPGERVNLDPVLVSNSLVVLTNIPLASACSIGGTSWVYVFNSKTGGGSADFLANELAVGFDVVNITGDAASSGGTRLIITKSGGDTTTKTPPVLGESSQRSSWRELP